MISNDKEVAEAKVRAEQLLAESVARADDLQSKLTATEKERDEERHKRDKCIDTINRVLAEKEAAEAENAILSDQIESIGSNVELEERAEAAEAKLSEAEAREKPLIEAAQTVLDLWASWNPMTQDGNTEKKLEAFRALSTAFKNAWAQPKVTTVCDEPDCLKCYTMEKP